MEPGPLGEVLAVHGGRDLVEVLGPQARVAPENRVLVDPLRQDCGHVRGPFAAGAGEDRLDRAGVEEPVGVVAGGAVAVRLGQRPDVQAGAEPQGRGDVLAVVPAEELVERPEEREDDEREIPRVEAEDDAVAGVGGEALGIPQLRQPRRGERPVDEFGDHHADRRVLDRGQAGEVLGVDREQRPVAGERAALGVGPGNGTADGTGDRGGHDDGASPGIGWPVPGVADPGGGSPGVVPTSGHWRGEGAHTRGSGL